MNEEITQLKKEQEELVNESQKLDKRKDEILTRLVELQGILKYLETKKEN